MVAIASEVCLGFGGLLILAGLVWLVVAAIISLRSRPPEVKTHETTGEPSSVITELVKALTEFFKEIGRQPKPLRLIFTGVLLLLVGAGISFAA